MGKRKHCGSVSQYLKGIKSQTDRTAVRKVYIRLRLGDPTFNPSRMSASNEASRILLHRSLFEVENEIESKAGGQPEHPRVVDLRRARNLVLDDLGWNEYPE